MTQKEFEAWIADQVMPDAYSQDSFEDAARELFDLLSPAWIPVSERLPENGPVLMCFLEPSFGAHVQMVEVGYYDSPDDYETTEGIEDVTGWRFWLSDKKVKGKGVTYWMPLPPLPAEDL